MSNKRTGSSRQHSRFEAVARKAMAQSAAGVAVTFLAACGSGADDASVFASTTAAVNATAAPTSTPSTTAAPTTEAAPTTDSATTAAPTTQEPTTAAPSTTEAATTSDGAAASGSVGVDFTFTASGGRIENPYIAVWVENADGALVKTLSLWYEAGRGTRWLHELRTFYALGASDAATTTGPTRVPGQYQLEWDLTDLNGSTVSAGQYTVFIEAAREKGPYEMIQLPITVGGEDATITSEPYGELTAASVTYQA